MPGAKEKENKLKKYPFTKQFKVVDTVGVPHFYCITPKHVAYASDYCGGMLGKEAIKESEEHGAKCGICKGELSFDEHKQALLVEVSDNRELKDIPELKKYLLRIKKMATKDNFAGFAFKQKKVVRRSG